VASVPQYELTIDLNTLNHLGIGLYSNIPAVLSEAVANSWDADASKVEITIDTAKNVIKILDDGWGMTREDINKKYLKVGYSKRDNEPTVTPKQRKVMGRKGIGKLSLFSIAQTIEVHSVKNDGNGQQIEKNGFIMNTKAIEKAIEAKKTYHPDSVDKKRITITSGTKLILSDLKKGVQATESFLKKRLARRFSIIGQDFGFSVFVNRNPISVEDRDYFEKIQYLWTVGEEGKRYLQYCKNATKNQQIDGIVDKDKDYRSSGWVGTFDEQKSIEEGNNTIVVLARGKLIHEDILKDVKEGGIFTKYLIGEIRADFLDLDEEEDIATSDRQSLKENSPRFLALKRYVQEQLLKAIQRKWSDWRREEAEKKALENPVIKQWFEELGPGNKNYARKLFTVIESFPIEDPAYKKELYKHGILAFETLALKDNLQALDKVNLNDDFDLIATIFDDMDELEAVHYWQITKNRVEVLKKFENIAPTAKEKILQKHIFDHLWLLDPSWERASTDEKMEQSVKKEWKKLNAELSKDEKKARIDIRYRTAAGKHIIIELKRYNRSVSVTELVEQITKYRRALEKCLQKAFPGKPHIIEIICILGSPPLPQDEDKRNRDILRAADARYITYDELIQQTRESYRDYLDKQKEISRIQALIEKL
jgi:Histidine kinase-, DNA gyrase B-, and HSP90-like ATPase